MAKYDRLSGWLAAQPGDYVECSFSALHDLVGGLPRSARSHRPWWGNDRRHVQAQAWLAAGFHVAEVNIAAERVAFRRGI
jgi:hypothetical protein